MSASSIVASSSSCLLFLIRCSRIHCCGGTRVLSLNILLKWLRDRAHASASSVTDMPTSRCASIICLAVRNCQGLSCLVDFKASVASTVQSPLFMKVHSCSRGKNAQRAAVPAEGG